LQSTVIWWTALPLDATILETLRRLRAAALASSDPEPNAMNVATADPDGRVHSRMVLRKPSTNAA
jgi:pyridoxamine 5'-phosphate oxidase